MIGVKGNIQDSSGTPLSDLDVKVLDFVAGNERLLAQPQPPDQNGNFDIQLQDQIAIPINTDTIHLVLIETINKFKKYLALLILGFLGISSLHVVGFY
jgi:hypothetical protein